MNRVVLSGSVRAAPDVAYTPRGQKIVIFPMWVEEGGFAIDVLFAGENLPPDLDRRVGNKILVMGMLASTKRSPRDALRVKASKILWMEE